MPYYGTDEVVDELVDWFMKFKDLFDDELKGYFCTAATVIKEQQIQLKTYRELYGDTAINDRGKRKPAVWMASGQSFSLDLGDGEQVCMGTICSNCGSVGASNYLYCPQCGSKMFLGDSDEQEEPTE